MNQWIKNEEKKKVNEETRWTHPLGGFHSACFHLVHKREQICAPTTWNCISSSFPNTAAEPRSLQKCVLRHHRGKKKSLEGWFWKLLSVGGAESVLELVGSGRKTFTIGDLCAEKLIIYNM